AALWHITTQNDDGGFAYHPGTTDGPERGASTQNLTNAGTASLIICRMYLYPNAGSNSRARQRRSDEQSGTEKPKFGVLEPVPLDEPQGGADPPEETGPNVSLSQINESIDRGMNWAITRFRNQTSNVNTYYYHYTVERLAALLDTDRLGPHDWYGQCAAFVVQTQAEDGSWNAFTGRETATSFAVLFLTRSTAKSLGRTEDGLAGGLLSGGRGLPDDLSSVQMKDGEVQSRKIQGPLDELLAALENPDSLTVPDAQTALIDKVQLSDREELIGNMDRLRALAKDPRVEVRRTAVWALGRSGDLNVAPLLIEALRDPNLDVVVEARNALCYVTRKPLGFGAPETPFEAVPETASDEQKRAAAEKWRQQVMANWQAWLLQVRRYEERDGLHEPRAKSNR
ncbi:MAG: HEAT repeat domain-containing protein, partial [Planctomycetaceae bacterium]